MTYDFPPDLRERLEARLLDGAFQTEDEVLRAAMDALDQMEQERLFRWEERNRLAVEQSQQGHSRPLDTSRLLARLRERLAGEGIVG